MKTTKIDPLNAPDGATHHSSNQFYKINENGVFAWIVDNATDGRWVEQERIKALGLPKIPNHAEINEQARSDAIDKLADEIAEYHGLTGARVTHQELAMHLYALNYRRFEILDDAP